MERLTEAAFGQRRKMLRSSLKPHAAAALERLDRTTRDRHANARAETLTVAEFVRRANGIQPASRSA